MDFDLITKSLDCTTFFLTLFAPIVPGAWVAVRKILQLKDAVSLVEDEKEEVMGVVNTLIKSIEGYSSSFEHAPKDATDKMLLKEWITSQATAHGTENLLHVMVEALTTKKGESNHVDDSENSGVV